MVDIASWSKHKKKVPSKETLKDKGLFQKRVSPEETMDRKDSPFGRLIAHLKNLKSAESNIYFSIGKNAFEETVETVLNNPDCFVALTEADKRDYLSIFNKYCSDGQKKRLRDKLPSVGGNK